jgi:hypothetical protein
MLLLLQSRVMGLQDLLDIQSGLAELNNIALSGHEDMGVFWGIC